MRILERAVWFTMAIAVVGVLPTVPLEAGEPVERLESAAAASTPRSVDRDAVGTEDSGSAPTAAGSEQVYRNLVYATRPSGNLLADIYVPHGDGPFPAILMIHGGAWMSGSKWHMARHAREAVAAGYTVVSINYRLAPRDPFPAQIDDCRAALRWMHDRAERYKIDPARIAAYGYSAGGHLACLLGLTGVPASGDGEAAPPAERPRLRAIVAGGAPCDFRDLPLKNNALGYFLGGTREEKPEIYVQASPAAFASPDAPPVFFFHGQDDSLVPAREPARLMKSLKSLGVRCELLLLPNKGHIATFLDKQVPVQALAFLDQVLRPEKVEAAGSVAE